MRMWGTTRRRLSIRWDWGVPVIASSTSRPALLLPAMSAMPPACHHRIAIPLSIPFVREGAVDQDLAPAAVVEGEAAVAAAQRGGARLTAPSSITTTGRFT